MKNYKKVEFTAGISYKEHKQKAKEVYDNEVAPLLEKDAFLQEGEVVPSLTLAQKAHLNCQSPI